MKAAVCTKYGPPEVLQIREVAKPVPKANELLIRICAATVTMGDCEIRSFRFRPSFWVPFRILIGILKPRRPIQGMYFAGKVESVGTGVTSFTSGDHVYGTSGIYFGAHAEYLCMPERGAVAIKPASMSFEEAAAVPIGGINALHFLKKAALARGEKILINGAGGSIGTFAVQLAKYYGAVVTVVDSADKLEMLRELGADHGIDYVTEDFAESGETYDVIFDVIGKSSFSRSLRSLTHHGRYLLANPRGILQMGRALWTSMVSTKKVVFEFADERSEELRYLTELIEKETIRSVIDKRYPLEHIVEAHRYVEQGHKKGNVALTMNC